MKKQKTSLLQRMVLGAGAITSAFGGGCMMNEYDMMSLAAQGYGLESETPEEALFWDLTSEHMNKQANREDRRRVAESIRQENYSRESIPIRELPEEFIVSCTSWDDYNGDGIFTTNEFANLNRQVYNVRENPRIVIKVKNSKGEKLKFKAVYTEKLSSALSQALLGGTKTQYGVLETIPSNDRTHEFIADHPGTYKFDFYAGFRHLGTKTIQVKE